MEETNHTTTQDSFTSVACPQYYQWSAGMCVFVCACVCVCVCVCLLHCSQYNAWHMYIIVTCKKMMEFMRCETCTIITPTKTLNMFTIWKTQNQHPRHSHTHPPTLHAFSLVRAHPQIMAIFIQK